MDLISEEELIDVLNRMEKDEVYPNLYEDLALSKKYTVDQADLIIHKLEKEGLIDMSPGTSRAQGRITTEGLLRRYTPQ